MTTIHQVIPVLAPHDAVGNHTLALRDALRAAGIDSEVFAEMRLGHHRGTGRAIADYPETATADLLIYQSSTGSGVVDWLLKRPEPLAVNYHNITPASFFEAWDDQGAASMRRARVQLGALARRSRLALADSPFNALELRELGYDPVVVAPLLLDLESRLATADQLVTEHLARTRSGRHWLFVGRLAPNKCQHDLVAAFAAYRAAYDPGARLTLIGSEAAPSYSDALYGLIDDLDLHGSVTIAGSVTDGELSAYYDDADVFVCLSRHEGFCVPLLEAMRHDLPVVALAAAAVPDTVGDAAVLVDDSSPTLVAATVHQLLGDDAFRGQLVAAGRAVLAAHSLAAASATWIDLLRTHLGLAGGGAGG
jgi:glycosyltransferase involved in cell wall biosynthesis